MHDSTAYKETTLPELVESLPQGNFIVGDNAYTPSEHLVPVYGGTERQQAGKDDTNFFISQCRIHIERAFGIMQKRFSILSRPLELCMDNNCRLIMAIARMHNFCMNEHLRTGVDTHFDTIEFDEDRMSTIPICDHEAPRIIGTSMQRQAIHHRVLSLRLHRPTMANR